MDNKEHLIEFYFELGLSYCEILSFLACNHGVILSERTLHRMLRKLRLYRRRNKSDLLDLASFIEQQILKSGSLHGYRWMHGVCSDAGFISSKEDVRLMLLLLDPTGVRLRAARRLRRREYNAKGPNYIWHLDGYDKLKPFGMCIHGCVDGFSRHIMWLKVYCTNNDPKVIAGFYLNTVQELGGVPYKIRGDRGTENGTIEILQRVLKTDNSFIYGRSTANQRIESWWGVLRKHCTQYWIDLFGRIRDDGLFDGDFLDKALIQFTFSKIIQVLIIIMDMI